MKRPILYGTIAAHMMLDNNNARNGTDATCFFMLLFCIVGFLSQSESVSLTLLNFSPTCFLSYCSSNNEWYHSFPVICRLSLYWCVLIRGRLKHQCFVCVLPLWWAEPMFYEDMWWNHEACQCDLTFLGQYSGTRVLVNNTYRWGTLQEYLLHIYVDIMIYTWVEHLHIKCKKWIVTRHFDVSQKR